MFLTDSTISFPGLGIHIDPPATLSLFGLEIRYYALIICLGMILAALYSLRRCKQFGLTSDNILDLLLVGIPSAVVGARLYYVVFEWETFFVNNEHWYDFLNIRQGGLAIYGGVIGAVLGVWILTRVSKKHRYIFRASADMAGLGLLIGQTVGRWGNFMNREAFGSYADNFLAMRLHQNYFPDKFSEEFALLQQKAVEGGYEGYIQVHPTFLYESLWNIAGFILLHFLSKKRKFDGQVFLYYLAWYGLGRVWIEGMRTDSLWWGSFRVSQVLAGITFLLAVALLLYILLVRKPDPQKMLVNRVAAEAAAEEETAEED